jgi:hypothetical protein
MPGSRSAKAKGSRMQIREPASRSRASRSGYESRGSKRRTRTSLVSFIAALTALAVVAGAVAATPTLSGRWRLDARESAGFYEGAVLVLNQRGSEVTGWFTWRFAAEHGFGSPPCFTGRGGTLAGVVRGRTLTARLVYPPRDGHRRATASLTASISRNSRAITGRGEMLSGECGGGVYYTLRVVRAGKPR